MLAKQETTMKARRTVLGRVPARLKTRVIITRSMLVLLKGTEPTLLRQVWALELHCGRE